MATSNFFPVCARFDQFHVDFGSRVLQRSGVRVPVQSQPLQVLRLLLESEGKVVTREEFRKVLWPEGTFVDFELAVNAAVKKLRQALEDSADHPKFIETLPRSSDLCHSCSRRHGAPLVLQPSWHQFSLLGLVPRW